MDIETARKVPLGDRSIFIEDSATIPEMNDVDSIDSVDQAKDAVSPRVIKTHLPLEMLPPNLLDICKVIFVCRSPKDCCVSFYNHYLNVHVGEYNFKGNFSDFAGLFMDGMVQFGDYWTMLKVWYIPQLIFHKKGVSKIFFCCSLSFFIYLYLIECMEIQRSSKL